MPVQHAAEYEKICSDVPNASEGDRKLILRVYETLAAAHTLPTPLVVACADTNNDYIVIRVKEGISMFGVRNVSRLTTLSSRIRDITLHPNRSLITVSIWRSDAKIVPVLPFAPVRERKPLRSRIDWSASGVHDTDDQRILARIIDDVYNMYDRMPNVQLWLERITNSGAVHNAQPVAGTDAYYDATGCIGYALCFIGVPDVSGNCLRYLQDEYTAALLDAYLWCQPPAEVAPSGVLVVCVKRALAEPGERPATRVHIQGGVCKRKRE